MAKSRHKLEGIPLLRDGNSTENHIYVVFSLRVISSLRDVRRLELKRKPRTYCSEVPEDIIGAARVARN